MSFSCIRGGECTGCGDCLFPDEVAEDTEEEVMNRDDEALW
jgi:hypothetical protein